MRCGSDMVVSKPRRGVATVSIVDRCSGPGSARRAEALSSAAILAVAYDDCHSRAGLASKHHVGPRTINRVRTLVASAFFEHQQRFLGYLHNASQRIRAIAANRCDGAVSFAICCLRHDETREKLTLRMDPSLQPWQEENTWHVMVQRRAMVFGVVSSDMDVWRYIALVSPNIALTGTTAGCLYDALWKHASIKDTKKKNPSPRNLIFCLGGILRGWHRGLLSTRLLMLAHVYST